MNKFILGDFFNHSGEITDKSVDLVMTGIPDINELGWDENVGYELMYRDFMLKAVKEIARIARPDGFVVMCQTDRKKDGAVLPKHKEILELFNWQGFKLKDYKILVKDGIEKVNLYRLTYSHILIFTKNGIIAPDKRKGDYLKDVWVFEMPKNWNYWPSGFTDLAVKTFTKEGGLVVDPFAGRGTVLESAKRLNRNYWGCEIKKEIYKERLL